MEKFEVGKHVYCANCEEIVEVTDEKCSTCEADFRKGESIKRCSECDNIVPDAFDGISEPEDGMCPGCGCTFGETYHKCPECGQEHDFESGYCTTCGCIMYAGEEDYESGTCNHSSLSEGEYCPNCQYRND